MEERKVVEKRTEVTREHAPEPKTTNVNVGPDGSTQVQEEEGEVVDEPIGSTTIRHEETIEKHDH